MTLGSKLAELPEEQTLLSMLEDKMGLKGLYLMDLLLGEVRAVMS